MADILIRGMEMPKDDWYCSSGERSKNETIVDNAPAVLEIGAMV